MVVGSSEGICNLTSRTKRSDFSNTISPIQKTNPLDIEALDLADPYFYKPGPIDLIIGSDYLPFINLSAIESNIENTIEARESHFRCYD